MAQQQAIVDRFNQSHENIELVLEVVPNEVAADTLRSQIEARNAPDIVGPVGIWGANSFRGAWLDLGPLVAESGFDLSQYDPALIDFYREDGNRLQGLPFAVFPSFVFYNRDLFDQAGLPYPPHRVGERYADGDPWTFDKMEEIALRLTRDANGNDATHAAFDPEQIEQFGLIYQWSRMQRMTTTFGPGMLMGDGGEAQLPPHWQAFARWYHEGIWEDHYIPNYSQVNSPFLADNNAFGSGRVAMGMTHLWYICCLGEVGNWDIAAMPAYEGQVTAPLHADTFRILSSTAHPKESFEVLRYFLVDAAPELLQLYGGMPAHPSLQAAFFAGLDEKYPNDVDWQVAVEALSHVDHPSHEAYLPNPDKAQARLDEFMQELESTPDLDVESALAQLEGDLSTIFAEVFTQPPISQAPVK